MRKLCFFLFTFLFLSPFLISCTELNFDFMNPQEETVLEAPPPASQTTLPAPQGVLPKEAKVIVREIRVTSSDYANWNVMLGGAKTKGLSWRDAKAFPQAGLFFFPGGFSLNGKKYSGSLSLEKDSRQTLRLINGIDFETYLKGVIPSEMPHSWPLEALKAQAVVARTYAVFGMTTPEGFLESSVMDQVYGGEKAERPSTSLAVDATKDQTLTFQGKIFPSYFHSASGGITTTIPYVWPKKQNFEAIESVKDPYSTYSPQQNWQNSLSPAEISEAFRKAGYNFGSIRILQIAKRDPTGRALTVRMVGSTGADRTFQGNDFRLILGWKVLKSTFFEISSSDGKFIFTGHGFGHGVGFSQWGAKAMAERGYKYKDILKFYFPKAELTSA